MKSTITPMGRRRKPTPLCRPTTPHEPHAPSTPISQCYPQVDRLRGRASGSKELSPSDKVARLLGMAHASFGGLAAAGLLSELRGQVPAEVEGPQLQQTMWTLVSAMVCL